MTKAIDCMSEYYISPMSSYPFLSDHFNVHMNTYQCEGCKKSFGRKRYLETHLKACPSAPIGPHGSGGADDEENLSYTIPRPQQYQVTISFGISYNERACIKWIGGFCFMISFDSFT